MTRVQRSESKNERRSAGNNRKKKRQKEKFQLLADSFLQDDPGVRARRTEKQGEAVKIL